ncbi:DUF5313 family protein [Pseudonocardia hierapolitana]|uniref:DUF5313 family protein n=1 Tax=Pseudonocardia hierapolitana TaxID=1128676 RepID=UPI001FE5C806|nr:DUF5313 family protein [Pseudonocardia hierapolitana]
MSGSDARPVSSRRPGPARWLWYAFGGRLPAAHREWVLYDLTCRTWPLRHLARLLTQLVPVVVILLVLIPGPLWIRVMGVLVADRAHVLLRLPLRGHRAASDESRLPQWHCASGSAGAARGPGAPEGR